MARPSSVAWLAALALGCDGGPGSSFLPTSDSGTGTHDSAPETTRGATQVGSEGFWGCPIEGLDPLDPTDEIPGLGVAAEVAAKISGAWSLTLTARADGSAGPGALVVSTERYFLARSAGCGDHLVAEVGGTAERATVPLAVSGWLGARPGEAALLLTADEPADTVAARWGLEAPPGSAGFRFSLAATDVSLSGVGAFATCGPTEIPCATTDEVLDVTGAR